MRALPIVVVIWCGCGGGSGGGGTDDVPPDSSLPAIDAGDVGPARFTLREVGRATVANPVDLVLVGSLLYVSCDSSEVLRIVDVQNPAAPTPKPALSPPGAGGANGRMAVSGTRAYLAHESDGLIIADVTNPDAPAFLGAYTSTTPSSSPKDVVIDGTLAYVADQDLGLVVVDVANPALPTRHGSVATSGPFGIARSGTTAYLADNDGGLSIVNIANPAAPAVIGGSATYRALRNLAVRGTTVFALKEDSNLVDNGLIIIDAANPASLARLSRYATTKENDVHVDGRHAYIAGDDSVEVVDINNLRQPTLVTSFVLTGQYPTAVAASATHVYVAARNTSGGIDSIIVLEKVPQ